uniref:Uncharacterized protein n=1 Tax=Arundo donax TaxID=35708 RepID=A0A0A8YB35_ARUDO
MSTDISRVNLHSLHEMNASFSAIRSWAYLSSLSASSHSCLLRYS